MKINITSTLYLENWTKDAQWTTGIGGSESTAIELAVRLAKRGHDVTSYIPDTALAYSPIIDNTGKWRWIGDINTGEKANWLIFRDPSLVARLKHPENNVLYISQDTDCGGWTTEGFNNVTKYITLCDAHAKYTLLRYPELRDKVYKSSNGINVEILEELEHKNIPRNPNKIIYPSSPDRGLMLILENWFRIRERHREAELHIFYGLNNIKKMYELNKDWRGQYIENLEKLIDQKGIIFRGRVNQRMLYEEMLSSNIFWYPNDFFETSCINVMACQAAGAIPVTNELGALKENVFHGFLTAEVPQQSSIAKCRQIDKVIDFLRNPDVLWRNDMMAEARKEFSLERIVDQYERWLNA